jgi:hypothetical protein
MKPYIVPTDDGSLWIEWAHKLWRLAIVFEIDLEKSSWYYVEKNGVMENGPLPAPLLAMANVSLLEAIKAGK